MLQYLPPVVFMFVIAYRYMTQSREVSFGIRVPFQTKKQTDCATQLDHIPTIGYGDPLLGCLTAIRYIFDAKGLVDEGYRKAGLHFKSI